MKENKEQLQVNQEENVTFEEMENAEEFGAAKDYLTGVGIGVGIVVGIVTLT